MILDINTQFCKGEDTKSIAGQKIIGDVMDLCKGAPPSTTEGFNIANAKNLYIVVQYIGEDQRATAEFDAVDTDNALTFSVDGDDVKALKTRLGVLYTDNLSGLTISGNANTRTSYTALEVIYNRTKTISVSFASNGTNSSTASDWTDHIVSATKNWNSLNKGDYLFYTALAVGPDDYNRYVGIKVNKTEVVKLDSNIDAYLTLQPPVWKAYPEGIN